MSVGKEHFGVAPNVAARHLDSEERRLAAEVKNKLNEQVKAKTGHAGLPKGHNWLASDLTHAIVKRGCRDQEAR